MPAHAPLKQVPVCHHCYLPNYRCLLSSPVKPTLSATATPVQVLQGNPALLAVTVQDPVNPELVKDNFTWTFGITQQSTTNILENGSLSLTSVQPSQTGSYTCAAVNSAGSGSTTVRLEVLGEKLLQISEKNVTLLQLKRERTLQERTSMTKT